MTSTSSSSLGIADIVGIAIGGVLGLATVIGVAISIYALCCKKNNKAQVWAQPSQQYPPYAGYGQPMNTGYGQPMNTGYGQPMNTGYYPQQPPYGQSQQQSWNKPSTNNDQPPPPPYRSPYPESNSYENYKH